jgi:hypothetical protein
MRVAPCVLDRRMAKDRAMLTDWYGQHKLIATP